ncbi:MAG: CPBP family intramembrane metalloprotease [Rhodobiaceae bacterium]|nr:CPBP family intramembrane metalloprotease [Rhodobiaceae bacterium]
MAVTEPTAEVWPRPLKLLDMLWGVALIVFLSVVFGAIVGVRLVLLGYDQNEILGFLDLPEGKFQLLLTGLASMFLGTLVFLTIFARWRGLRLRDLGLQKSSRRYLAQAMLGLVVVLLVAMALEPFLEPSDVTLLRNANADLLAAEGLLLTVSLVFVIVLVPFAEELFYRAALFGALSKYMPTSFAAFLATVLFAASHTQYFLLGGMAAAVGTFQVFLIGGILSWLYVRSRSIWPPVLLHVANNAIAFLPV